MRAFIDALHEQRWDDHRYYHHSRINQALHLVSALTFLTAYVIAMFDVAIAALLAWLVSMTLRQAGHFFFEPHDYDHVNDASHEHKEDIKVGYNLRRKCILMSIWALSPFALIAFPTLGGLFEAHQTWGELLRHIGLVWFWVGVAGLVVRTVHLFFLRGIETGLVWAAKIVTDPFHDVMLYYGAPLALMRGELIDTGLRNEVEAELAERRKPDVEFAARFQ